MKRQSQFQLKDIFGLIFLIGMLFSFMLGSRPLSAPDEGRYMEIPREMVAEQEYVTPRLNGVKYFEKPPLMYWLTSLSIKIFGVNEWAGRAWPALLGLVGCLAVYVFGARFFSRNVGVVSALVLASNILFYAHSRLMILDMGVTFFISISLLSFLWATQASHRREQNWALVIFFSSAACSTLTKGLIGMAIPGSIILLWVAFTRNLEALRLAFKPWGIVLFLLIAAPWHILASLHNPEFPEFYFIREHILRYLTPIHGRTQPMWFFLPIVLIGWFPWTSLLVLSLKEIGQKLKQKPIELFLILWVAFVFVFFSISNSKLIPYILPIFPPLSLILGGHLVQLWESNKLPKWVIASKALFSVLVAGAMVVALKKQGLWGLEALQPYVMIVLAATILSALVFFSFIIKQQARPVIVATGILALCLLPTLNATWPYLDRRSVKTLALHIQHHRQPGDKIIAYGRYYQDLPPYVHQKIIVVGWQGELDFGMSVEDTSRWMMTKEQFLKVYNSLGNVYIVTRKEFLKELEKAGVHRLKVLAETEKDILLTNKP